MGPRGVETAMVNVACGGRGGIVQAMVNVACGGGRGDCSVSLSMVE